MSRVQDAGQLRDDRLLTQWRNFGGRIQEPQELNCLGWKTWASRARQGAGAVHVATRTDTGCALVQYLTTVALLLSKDTELSSLPRSRVEARRTARTRQATRHKLRGILRGTPTHHGLLLLRKSVVYRQHAFKQSPSAARRRGI